jgi:uncharacterized protein
VADPETSRIGRFFLALHERLVGTPMLAWIGVLVLVALVTGGILQFRFVSQMTDLMPEGAEGDRMVSVLENFKLTGALLLHVEDTSDQADPARVVEAVDRICGELEASGRFKHVLYRVESDEQARMMDAVFPRRYVLLPELEVLERVSDEGIARGLERTRARLLSPQSSFTEPMLRTDPLGFGEAVLARVLTGQQQFTVRLYHGRFMSEDRRSAMVLAEPHGSGMEMAVITETLAEVQAVVDGAIAELGDHIRVGMTGGPVYSVSSAGIIQRDIKLSMGVTGVGILLIFLLFFRSFRVMLMAYTPPILGVAGGVALLGFVKDGTHGLSLAFGAAMLGITVDYTIHMFTRALQMEADLPRVEAVRRTLVEVTPSLTMGCLTTMIGFGTLMISDTVVLRDMSVMALGGIGSAFLLCAVTMPLAWRLWGGKRRARGNRLAGVGKALAWFGGWIERKPLPFFATWFVITAAVLVFAPGVDFDGDIRNMDYQPPEIIEQDERFQDAFGAGLAGAMVVVEGEDLEAALQANDRLFPILQRASDEGLIGSMATVANLMPSLQTQQRRLSALLGEGPDVLAGRLTTAAYEQGFTEGWFQPFADELGALSRGEVGPLRIEELAGTSMGIALERRIAVTPDGAQVLTLVETASGGQLDERALDSGVFPHELAEELREAVPGTLVVSFTDMAARLMTKVKHDLASLGGVCLVALTAVLMVYYRRPGPTVMALMPCVVGFGYTAGLMTLIGEPLNLMNVCGVAITLGISIDYGVFIVDRLRHRGDVGSALATTGTAILVSAVTTMIGLGTMAVAHNPAMASMGLVVIFGVFGGLFTALVGVPSLARLLRR